jgi:hypothetical protein
MRALLLFLLASSVMACAKRIPVSYEEPPPIFIEGNAPLFVKADTQDRGGGTAFLQVMGSVGQGLVLNRWAATEVVEREFAETMRRGGYTVAGGPQGAVLHVKLEPLNWSGESNDQKTKAITHGVLQVDVQFVDPSAAPNAPPVLARKYTGKAALSLGEQGAMDEAARQCAQQLLADLAPRHVVRRLPLDKSDPLTEPGINACTNDRFEEGLQLFNEASAKAPQSAPLIYNRGVLTLWKGQLDEADALLSQAIKLRPEEGDYADAKAFSEAALKARAGWGGRTPPPPPAAR